jgi:hypothetical protein
MIHEIQWRRSSFSGGGDASGGNCVEAAQLPDGRIAFRDSKNPSVTVSFGRSGARAWIDEMKVTRSA